jgi:DNA-binding transcriptional MocR family regulator
MIILNLERKSKMPLFRQIFQQLKRLIENNTLEPGFRMPSTRTLAEKHGINRSTVYKAYEELWALGYMESRPGSYSVVRKRQKIATPEQKSKQGLIQWETISSDVGQTLHHAYRELKSRLPLIQGTFDAAGKSDVINFASLDLDPRLFPIEDFRRCLNTVLVEQGGKILRYGEGAGYKPLREYIAGRLRVHGISTNFDEIVITNGCQNAIELVLKFLTVPGSRVATESPTYTNILPLLKYFKTGIIGIPMKPDGMDLDFLGEVLSRETQKPAFVYTMPNFHNPTGVTTDQPHRERLLALCETYAVPLVEDGFEEEMKYYGKVPLPIKSMDRNQVVIYMGTFSKVLFPGIRIGWIAAENKLIERLEAIKKFSDLSTNTLLQAALYEFCEQGHYNRHVKRMHREYRKRMHTALTGLKEHLPGFDRVSWTEPAGGYLIWMKLQDTGMDRETLKQVFIRNGVTVMPGTSFYPESSLPSPDANTPHQYFRLSISTLNENEIREGIRRLAKTISKIYSHEGHEGARRVEEKKIRSY